MTIEFQRRIFHASHEHMLDRLAQRRRRRTRTWHRPALLHPIGILGRQAPRSSNQSRLFPGTVRTWASHDVFNWFPPQPSPEPQADPSGVISKHRQPQRAKSRFVRRYSNSSQAMLHRVTSSWPNDQRPLVLLRIYSGKDNTICLQPAELLKWHSPRSLASLPKSTSTAPPSWATTHLYSTNKHIH
ncbi:hypothetical protein BGZ61DRAFT_451295 [Ilyonectria robusta]|uniref:uncharacterized protein n=1 Tax=Ilyonectria robusta TaxID=1079257 RepID=UPI001E8DDB27|nr:uncharacterized protein BGZ61DRAFT_451295 [Ilyonectria robusta]KAH8699774.1 hypothetical protein BGZ61DRAFT_451295 [Ilyonectria robusta]